MFSDSYHNYKKRILFIWNKSLQGVSSVWKNHIFDFYYKPIERDRFLFARKGWGLFVYSSKITAVSLFFLCVLSIVLWLCGIHLISEKGKSGGLLFDVISQFADPGNIPSAEGFWGKLFATISAFLGVICLSRCKNEMLLVA